LTLSKHHGILLEFCPHDFYICSKEQKVYMTYKILMESISKL
jgi:hypothetical protein